MDPWHPCAGEVRWCVLVIVLLQGCTSQIPVEGTRVPALTASRHLPQASTPFHFLVGGHLYGAFREGAPRPASTFVRALPRLAKSGADFMISLGDCFYDATGAEVGGTVAVLDRLGIPVINAPGNHDVRDRAAYEDRFGPTWFAFSHGGWRFLILDTELEPWMIAGTQLEFLQRELAAARSSKDVCGVFVFGHRVVFGTTRRLAVATLMCNARSDLETFAAASSTTRGFHDAVLPALSGVAREKPVLWFAGDVGAFPRKTPHLFIDTDPDTGITWIATGIGDVDEDAVLSVSVSGDGSAAITPLSLTGRDLGKAHEWSHQRWLSRFFPDGLPESVRAHLR